MAKKGKSTELTQREILARLFAAAVTSLKTGGSIEQTLADREVGFEDIAAAFAGDASEEAVKAMREKVAKQFGALQGEHLYVVKKVAYPADSLDEYVAGVSSLSTPEWETVVLSGEDTRELGYRSENAGLEIYILWADSREEAVSRTYDTRIEPTLSVNGFFVSEPEELAEYDRMFTSVIEEPDRAGELLGPFFDLLGL